MVPVAPRRPPPTRASPPPLLLLALQLVLWLSLALNACWLGPLYLSSGHGDSLFPGEPQDPAAAPPPRVPAAVTSQEDAASPASEKLKIAGAACSTAADEALVRHLRDIVLVINVNNSDTAAAAAGLVRAMYGRVFDNVVVVGPQGIPELGVEARNHEPFRSRWYFSYLHFPAIVARYPKAAGYLWLEDDVALNYWALRHANKSKLWLPAFPKCRACQTFVPFNEESAEDFWDGWSGDVSVRRGARGAMSQCETKHIFQFQQSILPRKEGFRKMLVDVFYVPRRHADAMAFDLIPVFRDHRVRSQVAVPMMFYALELPRHYDLVLRKMEFRWEKEDPLGALRYWNKTMSAYHPWTVNSLEMQEHSLRILSQGDPCLLRFIPLLNSQSQKLINTKDGV